MRTSPVLLIVLSVGSLAGAGFVTPAEAAGAARRGLDMTTSGPSVAAQAAQAAQGPWSALPPPQAETVTSALVSGLTVRPEQRGTVIASSDAASLTSPDFTAADAQDPPLAVSIGKNTALGRYVVTNDPPPAGLLRTNPDLTGSPVRGEVAIVSVF